MSESTITPAARRAARGRPLKKSQDGTRRAVRQRIDALLTKRPTASYREIADHVSIPLCSVANHLRAMEVPTDAAERAALYAYAAGYAAAVAAMGGDA